MEERVEKHAHVLDLGSVHDQDLRDPRVDEPSRGIRLWLCRSHFLFLASKCHLGCIGVAK